MEFIYINNKSIKIIISGNEMSEMHMDVNALDYSDTKTKRFFWELMDKAYVETGFDSQNSKLYVRIFPTADGGCEMFITRAEIHKNTTSENRGFIFVTNEADKLFMLCERMKTSGYTGRSSLYCDTDNGFYLVCDTRCRKPSYMNEKYIPRTKDFLFVSEYGDVFELCEEKIAYLDEHMKLVCNENAVEKMTK